MPVPTEFLRGILGMLCLFFAHMAGRATAGSRTGRASRSKVIAWNLRTVLCGATLLFRHEVDGVVIGVYALAAAVYAAGWYLEAHAKPPEDLTHEIFPE